MQENKIKIIIIILIILMILTAVGGTILYITTDMFKSSETLFQKYIFPNTYCCFRKCWLTPLKC